MIELTHIGESITAQMFNTSPGVRGLFSKRIDGFDTSSHAQAEVQLRECNGLGFDGAHKIDVALLKDNQCVPVELKLGKDRLTKNQFETRFLRGCKTSHENSRISGNMISILDKKLPVACQDAEIYAEHDRSRYLVTNDWVLVCRESVLRKWEVTGKPCLSSNCKILAFEEIVEAFGGTHAFNECIKDSLSFDYYERWFENA